MTARDTPASLAAARLAHHSRAVTEHLRAGGLEGASLDAAQRLADRLLHHAELAESADAEAHRLARAAAEAFAHTDSLDLEIDAHGRSLERLYAVIHQTDEVEHRAGALLPELLDQLQALTDDR